MTTLVRSLVQLITPLQISTLPLVIDKLNEVFNTQTAFFGLDWEVETSQRIVVAILIVLSLPLLQNRDQ